MSDRLFVLASVVASVFVGSGSALLFRRDFEHWSERAGRAGGELGLAETLSGLHSATPFISVLGFMALGLLASGWINEFRRSALLRAVAASTGSDLLEATRAGAVGERRSDVLARTFLRASKPVLPLLVVLLLSGVAVLALQRLAVRDRVGGDLLDSLVALHSGSLFGTAHAFLWLFAGLLLILLNVFVTRIRAARLEERGVASHRVYEDIPQGAALGIVFGVLLSMALLAWSGDEALVPIAMLFSICWSIGVHLWAPIAQSGGWRALPFILALAVIFGDLFGAGSAADEAPAMRLWFVALALAFFMVLVARVGRRTLAA